MLDLVWLIPAFPLAGFALLLVAGRRLGEPRSGWVATLAMVGSFAATVGVVVDQLSHDEHHRRSVTTLFSWVPAGDLSVDIGFLADPLSLTMCLFITGVGALIHLYSIGYMHGDTDFSRFFAYLNLFAFSMLVLVLGDNMLLTFLGWEGVGACSYLLISFWFTDPANASAGKKAFITNRIGDWGVLVAMCLTFFTFGSLSYVEVLDATDAGQVAESTATFIAVMLFAGAIGKSAQFPLYLWLPDAMAGPTPVSALIHAATMVTSGIYLLTRVNPIIADAADWVPSLIAWVGVGTALFAATIAMAQTDMKKVLAYSTISQLGYMFLAVGCGAYVPAIFHMVTHAFFKALLFLGSGSVIHGMDGDQDLRHYGGLRKWMPVTASTFIIGWLAIAGVPPFAGFWSKDEILAYAWNESPALWAVGLVTAVLTAFYMTRQVVLTFFGRHRYADARPDEVVAAWDGRLAAATANLDDSVATVEVARTGRESAVAVRAEAESAHASAIEAARSATSGDTADDASDPEVLAQAVLAAEDAVTAAVMAVEVAEESLAVAQAAHTVAAADHAIVIAAAEGREEVPALALDAAPDTDDVADHLPDAVAARADHHPHESPWTMTLPLVVLAVLSVGGGIMQLPFAPSLRFLEQWLEPSLFGNEVHLGLGAGMLWVLAAIAIAGGLVGIAVAIAAYQRRRIDHRVFEQPLLADAWAIDRAVGDFMGGPGRAGFEATTTFDERIVDGAVNGVGTSVRRLAGVLRRFHNGLVRTYAVGAALGAVALLLWFLTRASW
ncbi:MAG: NADH-quinone oxidoreductase subunit L [Acidimicrobiales bacterium]|jgi:proton-translocating NADH-quinone oxidoreductase chain L|nr:NADH-quinone oxidoreductase subunit L [Acidimicrobiales bacterium]MDP6649413.1 NADH-quinone oxidoreductase subunit L [Acidimicrobiales bacterium]MDP6760499.1 NADH-quinone oxidoreductase subunit L [Acidimicrobiales bacterium]|tara:strand:+ start:8774 stop:11113 length:2340 start_codon:yes stop_codon:yes gene_type:complete